MRLSGQDEDQRSGSGSDLRLDGGGAEMPVALLWQMTSTEGTLKMDIDENDVVAHVSSSQRTCSPAGAALPCGCPPPELLVL